MEGDPAAKDPADPDPERTQHLEELLFQCLEARSQGDSDRLARLLPTDPAQAAMLQHLLGIADGMHPTQPLQRLGEYDLLHEIGGGGMGVVHLARQQRLQRLVAIKLIRPEMLGSAKMRERFHREARALARVAHPGICPIYDFGEFEGQPYLVMQYLPGKRLAEQPPPQNRAELDALLLQWEQVCEAVHVAHGAGLVHRDLKPQNVVLAADGRPVVLDFGLARILDDEQEVGLTTQNQPLGTPAYMAPERLTGSANASGPGVDVYALGVSLFQGITGELPFHSPVLEALWSQILRAEPRTQRLRQRWMPPELAVVVRTAMERDAARRYDSAKSLGEDLRRVRTGLPILAQPPSAMTRVVRWTQRNRAVAALLVGLSIALLITIALVLRLVDEGRHNRSQALAGEAARHHQKNPALQGRFAAAAADAKDLVVARSGIAQALADWQLQTRWVDRETRSNMAVSLPNGGMAAVVDDREVVASRALGGRVRFVRPDGGSIISLAIAPDEAQLALGGGDGKLCLLDLGSGASTMVEVGAERITLLQYSPDGARLAIATDRFEGKGIRTGKLHLLERATAPCRAIDEPFTGPNVVLLQFEFLRDSTQLLTVVQGKFVVAHRLADGVVTRRITNDEEPRDPIVRIQRVRDDAALVCGGVDGTVFEVALADGARRGIGRHAGRITAFALSPDGQTLASVGNDRTAKLWNLDPAALREAVVLRHPVMITNVAFHQDGRLLATGANDMAVRLWSLRGDQVLELASGIGATNLLSLEGERIWLGSEWNGSGSYELLAHGKPLLLGDTGVTALCLSRQPGCLWTGGSDGSLQQWSGTAVAHLPQKAEDAIVSIQTSADEALLLAIEEDGVAHVHDTATGGRQALGAGRGFLRAGWILDDGKTICLQTNGPAAEGNALTTFRRSASGAPFERLPEVRLLRRQLGAGTFDAPRQRLLLPRPEAGGPGGFVVLDLVGDAMLREIAGEPCSRVVCSPQGDLYATCMTSHVRLWRGLDAPEPGVLPTDGSGTNDLVFSHDGRHLGAVSKSGAVWLFATDDGELVWRGTVPAIGWSVVFSSDDRYLLTGDSDGVVRHWLVDPKDQRSLAEERLRAWTWDKEERRILDENGVDSRGAVGR